jgi:hypothetical protein
MVSKVPVKNFCLVLCGFLGLILYYTNNYYIKILYFHKIYNHTLFGPVVNDVNVSFTLQVYSSMLVLPIVGK